MKETRNIKAIDLVPKEDLDKNDLLIKWECPICGCEEFFDGKVNHHDDDGYFGGKVYSWSAFDFSCKACSISFKNPYMFNKRSEVFTNPERIRKIKLVKE